MEILLISIKIYSSQFHFFYQCHTVTVEFAVVEFEVQSVERKNGKLSFKGEPETGNFFYLLCISFLPFSY